MAIYFDDFTEEDKLLINHYINKTCVFCIVDRENLSNCKAVGTGTLIFLKSKCFILTAKHVLFPYFYSPKLRIKIGYEGESYYNPKSVYIDTEEDVALVEIECDLCPNNSIEILTVNKQVESTKYFSIGVVFDLTGINSQEVRFRLLAIEIKKFKIDKKNLKLITQNNFKEFKDKYGHGLGGISGGPVITDNGDIAAINLRVVEEGSPMETVIHSLDYRNCELVKKVSYQHSHHPNNKITDFSIESLLSVDDKVGNIIELKAKTIIILRHENDDVLLWQSYLEISHSSGKILKSCDNSQLSYYNNSEVTLEGGLTLTEESIENEKNNFKNFVKQTICSGHFGGQYFKLEFGSINFSSISSRELGERKKKFDLGTIAPDGK